MMAVAASRNSRVQNRLVMRPAGMSESDDDCDEMGRDMRRPNIVNQPAYVPQVNYQDLMNKACTDGNLEGVISAFAGGVEIDQIYSNGFNLLMNASNLGHAEIVEFLLENGANPNFKNSDLHTPLLVLCYSFSKNEDNLNRCAKCLISKNANVNVQDSRGNTPLIFACKNGHPGIVEALIAEGVNLNEKDSQGWTALFWAVYKGHLPIVQILVSAGARKKIKDQRGRIAYTLAVGRESIKEIANLVRPKHYAEDYDDSSIATDSDLYPEEDAKTEVAELVNNLALINNTDNQVAKRKLMLGEPIDLFTFLTITEEELQVLGIQHCWQRRLTLEFIKKYHLQAWTRLGENTMNMGTKSQTDSLKTTSITFSNAISIILDLENRLTVMEASAVALLRQWKTESMPKPEDYGNLPQLIKVSSIEARLIAMELQSLVEVVLRLDSSIAPPCDLIIEHHQMCLPLKRIIIGTSACLLLAWGVRKFF